MKDVAPEDRPLVGQLVNETREAIEKKLDETKQKLEAAQMELKLKHEVIDVTLPAKKNRVGHRHPNTIALEEVCLLYTSDIRILKESWQRQRKHWKTAQKKLIW